MLRSLADIVLRSANLRDIVRYVRRPHEVAINAWMWRRARPSPKKFIFVVGPPRSGTTLLHRILLNHPQIEGFSEETSIFSPKSLHDFGRFEAFLSREQHRKLIKESESVVDFFVKAHEFAFGAGNEYFAEKTPQHVKRLRFILRMFPNARVVHIVRDGRDGFASGRSANNIPQATDARVYARYWASCVSARLRIEDARIVDVRYEDFVRDPKEQLVRIMNAIGLPAEIEEQISLDRMALDERKNRRAFSRLGAEISDSTVGRWRNDLSRDEAETFKMIAGEFLQAYNYEV